MYVTFSYGNMTLSHRKGIQLNTDYPNSDYLNCQLTESPQPTNACETYHLGNEFRLLNKHHSWTFSYKVFANVNLLLHLLIFHVSPVFKVSWYLLL
jgi:hypothetical protein